MNRSRQKSAVCVRFLFCCYSISILLFDKKKKKLVNRKEIFDFLFDLYTKNKKKNVVFLFKFLQAEEKMTRTKFTKTCHEKGKNN